MSWKPCVASSFSFYELKTRYVMADAPVKKQPGQGGAKKNPLRPPLTSGRPGTRKPRPSELRSTPTKAPGSGTNGTSKTANKVSR